jgi:PhoH-like ATPase
MAVKNKIFVLDTSVLLHDHESITNFDDNYVAIPITVLEELDKFAPLPIASARACPID